MSLASISASPGVDGAVVLDTVINDDFAGSRADALDSEAAYYGLRAMQEEQALGPGYYVDLLRGMATDRAAMAQRLRAGNGAPNATGQIGTAGTCMGAFVAATTNRDSGGS